MNASIRGNGGDSGVAARRALRRLVAAGVILTLAATAAGAGLAGPTAHSAGIVGDPAAGKPLFVTNCGTCHTLKAAGTVGNLGENLDKVDLSEPTIIKAITDGGASVMTKAALAKYPTQMTGYKGTLSTSQIQDIAAFEYTATHAAAAPSKPSISGFSPVKGKPGTRVTIKGTDFTGAKAVKVGKLKAVFKVVSAKKIVATVPPKAKTGTIKVTTAAGTGTSPKAFKVTS
jgi:mono/diheme cytochrome c family protein